MEDDSSPLPSDLAVPAVDLQGWVLWAVTALPLFSGGLPSIRRARVALVRTLATLAMQRASGNVSMAAKALRTSRRTLREALKGAGRYPWCDQCSRSSTTERVPNRDEGQSGVTATESVVIRGYVRDQLPSGV